MGSWQTSESGPFFWRQAVQTIFDTVLSSRRGLGDIGVVVDPFTGRVNTCIPAAVRYPGGPVLKAADFYDDAQRQMVRGQIEPKLDPRLSILCDVLNPGAAHYKGKYLLAARFANIRRFTDHFLAESEDGIHWTCSPRVLNIPDAPPIRTCPRTRPGARARCTTPASPRWATST